MLSLRAARWRRSSVGVCGSEWFAAESAGCQRFKKARQCGGQESKKATAAGIVSVAATSTSLGIGLGAGSSAASRFHGCRLSKVVVSIGDQIGSAVGCEFQRMIWLRFVLRLPSFLAIGAIRGYQLLISPWIGPRCRFYPTCSQYGILVFKQYGFVRGIWKTVCRLLKCHPWHPGGHDPP